MTGGEMIAELGRLLRYDGQLVDVPTAEQNATLRRFATQGVRFVQRELRFPMLVHTHNVAAGEGVIDLERQIGVFLIERLYWQTPNGLLEIRLMVTEAERTGEQWLSVGSTPNYYRSSGGMIQLFPVPPTAGTLVIRGVKKMPPLTDAHDNQEIGDIPESAHFAAVYYAAHLYLQPYTELFQKSQFYYGLALDIARRVRGDSVLYGNTRLGEDVARWPTMPRAR